MERDLVRRQAHITLVLLCMSLPQAQTADRKTVLEFEKQWQLRKGKYWQWNINIGFKFSNFWAQEFCQQKPMTFTTARS